MTKCIKSEVNLKSTAYNLNGQSYFEQLGAYNSMSSHLRRILLAKRVVDDRNKNYMGRKKQFCKQIDCKPRYARTRITNDVVDRLAYDTLHHPADFARMSYDSRYFCEREDHKYVADCYDYDVICSRSRTHNRVICPNLSTLKTDKSQIVSSDRRMKEQSLVQSSYKKALKTEDAKATLQIHDFSEEIYEEDSYESDSDFLTEEVNHSSTTENSSRSYENSESGSETHTKDEEDKYAKFVYEITREIMHNGLYTDEELQEVFNNHMERNEKFLNMDKMLHEIYQLKLSLNMSVEFEDEVFEDPIRNKKSSNISRVRPPTPPNVLDDNSIMEKITSYKKTNKTRRRSLDSNKSVGLNDDNPELHVTERDLLISLVESNINLEQAQQIYKRLSFKSKDTPSDVAQAKRTSQRNENDLEQEKSSTTQDLVTRTDKNVQA